MKTEKTWITNSILEATKVTNKMPWERGATRTAFIAKREAQVVVKRATA